VLWLSIIIQTFKEASFGMKVKVSTVVITLTALLIEALPVVCTMTPTRDIPLRETPHGVKSLNLYGLSRVGVEYVTYINGGIYAIIRVTGSRFAFGWIHYQHSFRA
jgi:hypothetical protein